MTLVEIKEMLETLLYYKDSEITHNFHSRNNTFSLTYSKDLQTFQIKNIETGHIENYTDLESTSLALYQIINNEEKEFAE